MLPKDQVIAAVMEDDVQFYWTMMTIDLEEEANQELLQGITGLMVTIRGIFLLRVGYKCTKLPNIQRMLKILKRKACEKS